MLLPVPNREMNRNQLYSWAYHKAEVIARRKSFGPERVKLFARAKANRVVELFLDAPDV